MFGAGHAMQEQVPQPFARRKPERRQGAEFALDCCLRMIFSENRFALFRIMR
jgi:hypothetical protein